MISSRAFVLALALGGMALLPLACGDSTGPVPLRGVFTLTRLDGGGPPFVENDLACEDGTRHVVIVVADTFDFRSDSVVQRAYTRERRTAPSGVSIPEGGIREYRSYAGRPTRTAGGVIVRYIDLVTGAVRSDPAPDTLEVRGTRLTLRRQVWLRCGDGPVVDRTVALEYTAR